MKAPTVLIVDDNLANQLCIEQVFEEVGLTTLRASSAKEAMQNLLRQPVHCVVSDVMMTGMDGYELTRAIKQDQNLADIPVVLVTGKVSSDNERLQGFTSGAIDYLYKPILGKIAGRKVLHLATACQQSRLLQEARSEMREFHEFFTKLVEDHPDSSELSQALKKWNDLDLGL